MSSKLLNRRHRLVRVRSAQHAQAVAETVRAQEEAKSIESNRQRLQRVRAELFKSNISQIGHEFASYRELADRLERAGKQLEGALYDAHKVIGEKQGRQVEANCDKEIAQRLKERVHAQIEEQREARIAAIPRYRSIQSGEPE